MLEVMVELPTFDRRRILFALGGAAAGLTIGPRLGRAAGGELLELASRPENYETPVEALLERLTPVDRFYIRSHFDRPAIDPAKWRLSIGGLAGKPQTFSLGELSRFEQVTVEAVLQCAGNGRALLEPRVPGVQWTKGAMGNAEWRGVRLAELLAAAKPGRKARHLVMQGADRPALPSTPAFVRSMPIEKALHPDTLIATHMNGVPLPPSHGFPARVVVPGWVADDWLKWIETLTLSDSEAPGFFMEKAYKFPRKPGAAGAAVPPGEMGPMTRLNVKSVIARPLEDRVVPAGEVEVAGVAFSGEAAVKKVEVQLAGGPWIDAKLEGPETQYGWRIWRARLLLEKPGKTVIRSRATDQRGDTQPEEAVWNPSGYLHNAIDRISVEVRT